MIDAFSIKVYQFRQTLFCSWFLHITPKSKRFEGLKAARFWLDPDCLTCWIPSLISSASPFEAFVSCSSYGVLTNPSSSKIFLVLGLCITVFNICAFFLGVTWSACHTSSVPHFFEVLFWNPGDSSVVKKLLSFAFSRCLLTHSLIFSSFFFGCTSLFSDLFCFASFLGFLYGEWAMCLQTGVRFSALFSLFFSFFNQLFPIFFIMYPIFSFFSTFLLSSAIFSRERPWYWLSTLHSLIAWMDTRMYLEDRKCHVFVTLCNTKALNLPYVHPLYWH